MTKISDLKFYSGDLDREVSLKEYFHEILKTLLEEGEGFSGKRPLGNSGWTGDLAACLVKNGIIPGKIDEDGYLDIVDWAEVDKVLINRVLPEIFD